MSDYSVKAHRLVGPGVTYVDTTKKSGKMTPKFLVIHYTASANYRGDVETLSTSKRPASCQLVVSPDGAITQIGLLNDVEWHAGKSVWRGYSGLNSHSIGIEVTCPGPLSEGPDGSFRTWYGEKMTDDDPFPFVEAAHKNGGAVQTWAGFTAKQIQTVIDVGRAIMDHYDIKEAVGHDDIAPGRKIDPGPSCPPSVFAALNGNADDDDGVERPDLPVTGKKFVVRGVQPETLNFRASPNGEKRGELPENAIVVKIGTEGNWAQVRTPGGFVGWVFADYLKPSKG